MSLISTYQAMYPIALTRRSYSPTSKARGAIFRIFNDSRHAIAKANSISPIPAAEVNAIGIVNVHFTTPMLLKNIDITGLIIMLQTINPTTVERITVGINDRAVCRISCPVVKPRDFKIP